LYSKDGQTKEDDMFTNIDSSNEFEEFLDFIGDRVKLEGWKGFRGGLDVRSIVDCLQG
jgi:RAP1 GTPase activating protein 1